LERAWWTEPAPPTLGSKALLNKKSASPLEGATTPRLDGHSSTDLCINLFVRKEYVKMVGKNHFVEEIIPYESFEGRASMLLNSAIEEQRNGLSKVID